MHFFSPANVMRLLEVVRGDASDDASLQTAMSVGKQIGKVCVLSGMCYGFIGNRMLRHYGREAALCVMEGASPAQVDQAMERWGMAMGPLAVGDLAGLDIGYKAREQLSDEEKGPRVNYLLADRLVDDVEHTIGATRDTTQRNATRRGGLSCAHSSWMRCCGRAAKYSLASAEVEVPRPL